METVPGFFVALGAYASTCHPHCPSVSIGSVVSYIFTAGS